MGLNANKEIFCQVGFGYKKEKDEAYYHVDAEGEPYLFSLNIQGGESDTIDKLIHPLAIENLTSGHVDYDLLPQVLQKRIAMIARLTYLAIKQENPNELKELDLEDQLVIFQVDEPMAPRTLQ